MSEFESVEEELKFMADISDDQGDSESSMMYMRYLGHIRALAAQRDEGLAREAELRTSLEAVTYNLNKTDKAALALQQRLAEAEKDARDGSTLLSAVVEWIEDGFGGSRRRDELLQKSRSWLNDSNDSNKRPGCADGEKP